MNATTVADAVEEFLKKNQEALSIDLKELGPVRASEVSEALWQVHIPRQLDGIPVRFSRLVATIRHGNLVLLGGELWGEVKVDTRPSLAAEKALDLGFAYIGGKKETDVVHRAPKLELIPVSLASYEEGADAPVGEGYGHYLVWVFVFERQGETPVWEVMVDAHSGEIVAFRDTHQYVDRNITGGVYPQTSTDICPAGPYSLFDHTRCGILQTNGAGNPLFPSAPMCWADTGLLAPNDFTDGAGAYDWSLFSTSTTTLNGLFTRIVDGCGALSESSTTGNIDLGGSTGEHDCTVPGLASPGNTASARTTFNALGKMAEIGRGWLPSNTWLQSQLQANTNVPGSCNGFWSTIFGTVNFFPGSAVNGCRNAGENLTFIAHEWGHGLDDNDANGVLSNSSEGYADIAAIYRAQASCVFYGFFTPSWFVPQGCGLTADGSGPNTNESQTGGAGAHCTVECSGDRDADWAKHVGGVPDTPQNFVCTDCGFGFGPCGRQVHCAAAPARQAAWDLVARDLQAPPFHLDTNNAFLVGSKLFYQGSGNVSLWHACSCTAGTSDGCNASSGYMQWLAADDDNGNINDGTPHMTAIFNAFDRHNIACGTPAPFNTGCFGGPTERPEVTLTVDADSVDVNWTAVPAAAQYWVLRSEGVNGCSSGKALISTVSGATTYTDNEVLPGYQHCYTVVPVSGSSGACFGRASLCTCTTPLGCKNPVFKSLLSADFSTGIPSGWRISNGGSGGGASSTWNTNNPCGLSIGSPITSPWAEVNSPSRFTRNRALLQAASRRSRQGIWC